MYSSRNLASTKSTVFGSILSFLVIIAIVYGLYLCFKRWRRLRDFQELEVARARADTVLADLGNDDSTHGGGSQISMVENKRVEHQLVVERIEDTML